ncbi:hypothetical protein [Litchfieldia salsa]|uniref:Uncharacterized protein n=1 Tax=Litchfieldia salsa TaxID=930152 RepID=A0A1H0VCQ6_9BACI|nr:hypothetical protein [Litchfieldia salsa]SDP76143.1 hypothetical protein SAMN05216565_106186 [Litchfieldia salsa]
MKTVYAIELNEELLEDEIELLEQVDVQIFVESSILLIPTKQKLERIKNYIMDIGKYEESYQLIELKQAERTDLFYDFGFIIGDSSYLITELICSFNIIQGQKEQIDMALLQMEECLLAIHQEDKQRFFFIDIQQKELIERFAKAYEIEVSFFDLDKWTEND